MFRLQQEQWLSCICLAFQSLVISVLSGFWISSGFSGKKHVSGWFSVCVCVHPISSIYKSIQYVKSTYETKTVEFLWVVELISYTQKIVCLWVCFFFWVNTEFEVLDLYLSTNKYTLFTMLFLYIRFEKKKSVGRVVDDLMTCMFWRLQILLVL